MKLFNIRMNTRLTLPPPEPGIAYVTIMTGLIGMRYGAPDTSPQLELLPKDWWEEKSCQEC